MIRPEILRTTCTCPSRDLTSEGASFIFSRWMHLVLRVVRTCVQVCVHQCLEECRTINKSGSWTIRPPRLLLYCFPLHRRQILSDTTCSSLPPTAPKTWTFWKRWVKLKLWELTIAERSQLDVKDENAHTTLVHRVVIVAEVRGVLAVERDSGDMKALWSKNICVINRQSVVKERYFPDT